MLTDLSSTQDTLSNTLSKMKLQSFVAGAFDAAGDWAIEFGNYDILRFKVILKGECWLSVEGEKKKYHLKAGDCFLVKGDKRFVIAKNLNSKKRVKSETLAHEMRLNGIARINGGGEVLTIGTFFQLEGHLPKIVFGHLPNVIHVPAHLDQATILKWSIERFTAEFRSRNPGRSLMLSQLAPVMLLQTLRIYLMSEPKEKNWLVALADPKLSKAIEAMHRDFKRSWSIDGLAKISGMSRAGFALNFKKTVGYSPIEYLTQWRMQTARELLQSGDHSISEISSMVGYESESAFSSAFKKVVKSRPGFYQKNYERLNHADNKQAATPAR